MFINNKKTFCFCKKYINNKLTIVLNVYVVSCQEEMFIEVEIKVQSNLTNVLIAMKFVDSHKELRTSKCQKNLIVLNVCALKISVNFV